MTHSLYITCFNAPDMLERLIKSGLRQAIPKMCQIVLSDQSTDESCKARYSEIAKRIGGTHVHNENFGASEAKRAQIKHAAKSGVDIMSQISEDFFLPGPVPPASWLPSGVSFIHDCIAILGSRPEVKFVNWCMATGGGTPAWNSLHTRPSVLTFRKEKGSHFAHVEGEIYMTGWPYTARVPFAAKQVEYVEGIAGGEVLRRFPEGGEWILARYSAGAGACLVAQPVVHDRIDPATKPSGSRP